MFRAATEWALEERLPLVYLAANSGARVGLAAEVKQCLKVGGRPSMRCSSNLSLQRLDKRQPQLVMAQLCLLGVGCRDRDGQRPKGARLPLPQPWL
jgi:hypothetical protein